MTVQLGMLTTAHLHAGLYAEAIENVENAELVAVADEDEEQGREFAAEWDVTFDDRETVLEQIDAGIIAGTNASHREWTEAAAEAGVDVLCEKPLATSTADAREMVRTCDEAGVTLGVAMPVRFSEPAMQAYDAITSGEIGELQAMVGTNILKQNTGGGWMTDPDRSGGGAIMDHTVHVVDLARWYTDQEVTEVYTETGTLFSDIPVEDVVVLSMELEDGTPLTHDGSWRQPQEWDFWGDVTMRLIGTDGVIEIDCFDQTVTRTLDTGDDPGIDSLYWGTDMNAGMIRDFVEAVANDGEPAVTGVGGLREVKVVEAAYESGETGEVVEIEYDT